MTNIQYLNRYRNVVLDDPHDDDLFVCFKDQDHIMLVYDEEDAGVIIKCISCKSRKIIGKTTVDAVKKRVDDWDEENGR